MERTPRMFWRKVSTILRMNAFIALEQEHAYFLVSSAFFQLNRLISTSTLLPHFRISHILADRPIGRQGANSCP